MWCDEIACWKIKVKVTYTCRIFFMPMLTFDPSYKYAKS